MQPGERCRRAALLASPFLWLIGVTLFLPIVHGCDKVESPAALIRGNLHFLPLLTPFLCAELLAILLLVPLLRRVEPSRRWWLAALATVLPVFASPVMVALLCFDGHAPTLGERLLGGAALLPALLSAAVLVIGARRRGWPRLLSTVAAFTGLTLPLTTFFIFGLIDEHLRYVYSGSVAFVGAMLALTILTAASLRAITRA
jgi:hypothetical protein